MSLLTDLLLNLRCLCRGTASLEVRVAALEAANHLLYNGVGITYNGTPIQYN
jgi:hypothetical protein